MQGAVVHFARFEDRDVIAELYRAVAAIEGGLARTKEEITDDYVDGFLRKSLESGIALVARQSKDQKVVGEIHAYKLGPKAFGHVLGELTIAVHPDYQGLGLGKALFTRLLEEVSIHRRDILRIELIARESNIKAIEFYQKLGFQIEGRLANRIQSVGGGYESDIPMAWMRNMI